MWVRVAYIASEVTGTKPARSRNTCTNPVKPITLFGSSQCSLIDFLQQNYGEQKIEKIMTIFEKCPPGGGEGGS